MHRKTLRSLIAQVGRYTPAFSTKMKGSKPRPLILLTAPHTENDKQPGIIECQVLFLSSSYHGGNPGEAGVTLLKTWKLSLIELSDWPKVTELGQREVGTGSA